jgi:medium-chain acyl-[acyl-carrier-protein] hydrolase
MIFTQEVKTLFRDADADGKVGLRGYMNYFQDMSTGYTCLFDKGNDTIPQKYGICWLYTKYRLHINRPTTFGEPLKLHAWQEETSSHARIDIDCMFEDAEGPVLEGRLESCLFDIAKQRVALPADVEYPADVAERRTVDVEPFRRISRSTEGLEQNFVHTVRYAELDNNGHMTNLRYVEMFIDAFDRAFYRRHRIADFEIHYLKQCFEGEQIRVLSSLEGNQAHLAAVAPDGSVATVAIMGFEPVA